MDEIHTRLDTDRLLGSGLGALILTNISLYISFSDYYVSPFLQIEKQSVWRHRSL